MQINKRSGAETGALKLSFFSEICKAERGRRLVLALFAHRNDNEHDDGDKVREHLVQLHHVKLRSCRNVEINNVQSAEEYRGYDRKVRSPDREDDQRDGKPAAVAEGIVRPYAAGLVPDIVQAAEAGDHAADAGCDVLIFIDVYAGSIGSRRAFADSAQVKADARFLYHISGYKRNDNGGIGQKAVA